MPSYFQGFDVYIRNADGALVPQPSVTVDVYNVTLGASAGTISANAGGYVDPQSNAVAAGTVLRFSVSPYTPTIERTTVTNLADLEGHFENDLNLILEDNSTPTAESAGFVEVWAVVDLDFKNAVLVGTGRAGDTLKWPYQSEIARSVRFYTVPRSTKGAPGVLDLETGNYASFSLSNQETVTATGSITKQMTFVAAPGNTTQTLPTAIGKAGKRYTVKNTGPGTKVLVNTVLSQSIYSTSAMSSVGLNEGHSMTFESNGLNWFVV